MQYVNPLSSVYSLITLSGSGITASCDIIIVVFNKPLAVTPQCARLGATGIPAPASDSITHLSRAAIVHIEAETASDSITHLSRAAIVHIEAEAASDSITHLSRAAIVHIEAEAASDSITRYINVSCCGSIPTIGLFVEGVGGNSKAHTDRQVVCEPGCGCAEM